MTTATDTITGVRELIVPATVGALNAALMKNQIRPEKIISVILQQRRGLAIGGIRETLGWAAATALVAP